MPRALSAAAEGKLHACRLWKDPEATLRQPMKETFELLWQGPRDSHFWRYALQCRTCGQTYFFQFSEEIDWDHGKDGQVTLYVPYDGTEALERLQKSSMEAIAAVTPQLRRTSPLGGDGSHLGWIGAARGAG